MVGDAWVSFDRIQNFGLVYTCVAAWHLCACLSLCMIAQDDTECQLQKSPRREHTFWIPTELGALVCPRAFVLDLGSVSSLTAHAHGAPCLPVCDRSACSPIRLALRFDLISLSVQPWNVLRRKCSHNVV